ncbi:MAG: efflux RND transporter periplasmic adaptor subunit [Alphaproteobacteria bacterium]|nr:efflux RND transporter periplasmic adaptor subunit [Alphaproteobacteria bacterium]
MTAHRPPSAAVLIALALGLAACGQATEAKDQTKAAARVAITVSTVKVTKADVAVPIMATGSLTPSRQTDIGPSVDGIIDEVMVGVGSQVKKGQALFRTRDVDIKLVVLEQEKQVALARAQLRNAQADLKRQDSLKGGGWVSQSRMDTTKTNADVAAAQLGVWEARLAQGRQQLKDTIVRAPYDGVISRKDVYEGRFMATRFGGGGAMGGAAGVVQIMGIDPLAVIVVAPATYFEQFKVGMAGRIFVDGIQKPFEARVAVINYGIDYKARSVELRFALPNPGYKILPGLYCRVELIPEARKTLVVARKAILGPDGSRYAFTAQNGRAKKISLSIREIDGERVEILSNVPEGTELLTGPNLSQLADGVPVMLESAAKPTTQAQL